MTSQSKDSIKMAESRSIFSKSNIVKGVFDPLTSRIFSKSLGSPYEAKTFYPFNPTLNLYAGNNVLVGSITNYATTYVRYTDPNYGKVACSMTFAFSVNTNGYFMEVGSGGHIVITTELIGNPNGDSWDLGPLPLDCTSHDSRKSFSKDTIDWYDSVLSADLTINACSFIHCL